MAKVITDDSHYKNIADTIRSYTGFPTKYTPKSMPTGIGQVYSRGVAAGKAEAGDIDEAYNAGYSKGQVDGIEQGKQEANAITLELLEQFNTSLDDIIAEQNSYLVIAFKIGGNECTGLYAMRWGDWVSSEYNVHGITVDSRDGQIFDKNGDWIALDGDGQFDTDLIEANVNYQAL